MATIKKKQWINPKTGQITSNPEVAANTGATKEYFPSTQNYSIGNLTTTNKKEYEAAKNKAGLNTRGQMEVTLASDQAGIDYAAKQKELFNQQIAATERQRLEQEDIKTKVKNEYIAEKLNTAGTEAELKNYEEQQKQYEETLARPEEEQLKGFKGASQIISNEPNIPIIGEPLKNLQESFVSTVLGRNNILGINVDFGSDGEIQAITNSLNSDMNNIAKRRVAASQTGDYADFMIESFNLLEDINKAEENIKQKSIYSGKLVEIEGQIEVMAALDAQRRYILTQQDVLMNDVRTGKAGTIEQAGEVLAPTTNY